MAYFLNAGNLISNTGCVVGDYKIEWRLDSRAGDTVLISGNAGNTDPEIDARHPLVDEIVIGGTLYPVIIYSYLDGNKYTSEFENGSYYSPDLYDCLDPITVDVIDCDTVLNPSTNYQFTLTRLSNVGEKSRAIKFNIGPSTNYLAWEFTALNIPDQLNIYYCTAANPEGEIMDSIILGTGLVDVINPSNYPRKTGYDPNSPITPIVRSSSVAFKYVSTLLPFTYQAGDWVKFEILGNVTNPSANDTAWTLRIQCLETLNLTNEFLDVGKFDATSLEVSNNTTSCRLEVKYTNLTGISSTLNEASDIKKYFSFFDSTTSFNPNSSGVNTSVSTLSGSGNHRYNHSFPYSTSLVTSTVGLNSITNECYTLTGPISVLKNSTNLVITCSDIAEYNLIKDGIEYIQNTDRYGEFELASTTDIDYFGFYRFRFKVGPNCDTIAYITDYYIHWSTPITYDLANKKITFTMSSLTNSYPTPIDSCNLVKNSLDVYVSQHNSLYNNTSINFVTYIKNGGIGAGLPTSTAMSEQTYNATNRSAFLRFWTYPIYTNNLLDLESYGFCQYGTTMSLYRIYDKITITDINTYTIERLEGLHTNDCDDTNFIIIAQKP